MIAFDQSGAVWMWGQNDSGQFGDGTYTSRSAPTLMSGHVGFVQSAAGGNTYLLKNDGTVWATGTNLVGELGDGTRWNRNYLGQVSLPSSAFEVSAGSSHGVARLSNGEVWAWGANDYGQVGNGSWNYEVTPRRSYGVVRALAIEAGANTTFAMVPFTPPKILGPPSAFAKSPTTVSGEAGPGQQVRLREYYAGTLWGSATADGAGSWQIVLQSLPDGPHFVYATAIDPDGFETSSSRYRSFGIDNTAPDTSITKGPADSSLSFANVSFEFTATESSTFECSLDNAPYSSCTSPKSYNGLTAGAHSFRVRGIDQVGNVETTPAARKWSVDATRAVVTLLRPGPGLYVDDVPGGPDSPPQFVNGVAQGSIASGDLTVKVRALDPESGLSSFRYELDGVVVPGSQVAFDSATNVFTFVLKGASPGPHQIVARAYNGVGVSNFITVQLVCLPKKP